MKIEPICVPCIAQVRLRELASYGRLSDEERIEAMAKFLEEYSRLVWPGESTVVLATRAFKVVKRLLREEDPYREFKARSNKAARKLVPLIEEKVRSIEDDYERFRALVVAAVNANAVDPGVPFSAGPEVLCERLLEAKLDVDHTRRVYEFLKDSTRVAYYLDNAGEALIDLLLVKELASMGLEVTVLARGGTYQNDVTYEEALALGFGEYARVVSTGFDTCGPWKLSEEARRALEEADLIIAKGMACYETYLYFPPPGHVAHLFQVKCWPVARTLGLKPRAKVVLFRE